MSAESVVYYLNRVPESDPNDQTEWLLTALGQYTGAELRELLYVAEEPGFFELIRGLFALSDENRAVLQQFLETGNFSNQLAGNTPLIVDRSNGALHVTGTAHPIEHYIQQYLREQGLALR